MTKSYGGPKKDLPESTLKTWAALADGPIYYRDDDLSLVVAVRFGTVHLRVGIGNGFVVG